MRYFLLLTISFTSLANNFNYVYLDCGEPTKEIEKQNLLIRIIRDTSAEILDGNLYWYSPSSQFVTLDEYWISPAGFSYFLSRSDLSLTVVINLGKSHKTTCSISDEESIEKEIENIKSEKKARQQI